MIPLAVYQSLQREKDEIIAAVIQMNEDKDFSAVCREEIKKDTLLNIIYNRERELGLMNKILSNVLEENTRYRAEIYNLSRLAFPNEPEKHFDDAHFKGYTVLPPTDPPLTQPKKKPGRPKKLI